MRFLVLQKRAIGGKAGFKAALVVEISGQLFVHYFSKTQLLSRSFPITRVL